MQQTLIDPLILMPEDTIFADIDNKAAIVPCNSSGVTTADQWVEAHVSMYLGNVPQTISAIVCKIYDVVLGPDYTNDPAPSRYFRVEQTPATGYVKVYIKSGTLLTAPTIRAERLVSGVVPQSDLTVRRHRSSSSAKLVSMSIVPRHSQQKLVMDANRWSIWL